MDNINQSKKQFDKIWAGNVIRWLLPMERTKDVPLPPVGAMGTWAVDTGLADGDKWRLHHVESVGEIIIRPDGKSDRLLTIRRTTSLTNFARYVEQSTPLAARLYDSMADPGPTVDWVKLRGKDQQVATADNATVVVAPSELRSDDATLAVGGLSGDQFVPPVVAVDDVAPSGAQSDGFGNIGVMLQSETKPASAPDLSKAESILPIDEDSATFVALDNANERLHIANKELQKQLSTFRWCIGRLQGAIEGRIGASVNVDDPTNIIILTNVLVDALKPQRSRGTKVTSPLDGEQLASSLDKSSPMPSIQSDEWLVRAKAADAESKALMNEIVPTLPDDVKY